MVALIGPRGDVFDQLADFLLLLPRRFLEYVPKRTVYGAEGSQIGLQGSARQG